jgi:hypothetical protein
LQPPERGRNRISLRSEPRDHPGVRLSVPGRTNGTIPDLLSPRYVSGTRRDAGSPPSLRSRPNSPGSDGCPDYAGAALPPAFRIAGRQNLDNPANCTHTREVLSDQSIFRHQIGLFCGSYLGERTRRHLWVSFNPPVARRDGAAGSRRSVVKRPQSARRLDFVPGRRKRAETWPAHPQRCRHPGRR